MRATLHFKNQYHHELSRVPFTYGVPLPEGIVRSAQDVALMNREGVAVPVAVKPMATWPDGSWRWGLLDFIGTFEPSEKAKWSLWVGEQIETPAPHNTVVTTEDGQTIRVSNGLLEAEFLKGAFSLFASLRAHGRDLIDANCRCDIVAVNTAGKIFRASYDEAPLVSLEESSPLRTVVRLEGGLFAGDGTRLTQYRLKLHFFADNPYIKIEHSAVCREEPEYGVEFSEYRLDIETCLSRRTQKTVRQKNHGVDYLSRLVQLQQNVRLVVPGIAKFEGFGTPGVHGKVGKVLLEDESAFQENAGSFPHFLRPGAPRVAIGGGYAIVFPFLGFGDNERTVVASFLRMGPQHPKGIICDENRLSYEIWPCGEDAWRLSRGMTKTHHMTLSAFGESLSPEQIDQEAIRREFFASYVAGDPVQISLDPDYVRLTGQVEADQLLPYLPEKYPRLETKLAGVKLHGDPLASSGMMDYGEAIATNNEEDQGHQYALEYYRRGHYESYQKLVAQMLHNSTVDVVDWDPDPLRQGGTPYHTNYHQDSVCVPSHAWTEGMFEYAYVTGDMEAHRAAVGICEWILRYMEGKPHLVKQDGREIGWPIIALVTGYKATWDKRYLDAAFKLVSFYHEKVAKYGELLNSEPPGTDYCMELYGEYAGFEGMFKLWQVTQDEDLRQFALKRIEDALEHEHISFSSHGRFIDMYCIYAGYTMSGDEKWLGLARHYLPIVLSLPSWDGYTYRRLIHFLGMCHEHGLIEDQHVSIGK